MITITFTIRGSEHQPVLAFDTDASLKRAVDQLAIESNGKTHISITDDYMQNLGCRRDDIVATVIADVEEHWKYRNKTEIIRLRAQNDYNQLLGQDPTLKFMVGGMRPKFGGE